MISFIIPCYNSEDTIRLVVNEIEETMAANRDRGYDFEILLISDASPDDVFTVIEGLAAEASNIHGIELSRNFGQHAALMAGLRKSRGDIIVTVDDDGQIPVDETFKLIDEIEHGRDVVFGAYPTIQQNLFRRLATWLNNKMAESLIGKPKGIHATSFMACRRFIIDEVLRYENAYPYLGGLIFRATRNISSVPVNHRSRVAGKSGYSLRKLLSLFLNGFTSFSIKPLRVASYLGAICAIIGFAVMLYFIVMKIANPDIEAGYTSMMAVILFIGGLMMIILGLIGEYVGRGFMILNNSPQYVIRKTTSDMTKDGNQ